MPDPWSDRPAGGPGGRSPARRAAGRGRRGGGALLAAVLAAVLLGGCGEPPVDLDLPPRAEGQTVLDHGDVLDDAAVDAALGGLLDLGYDAVAVTYETEQAGRGEAARAGRLVVERWGADLVLVAVARPGDFTSEVVDPEDPAARERFFGIEPADTFAVPGDLREEIVEVTIPPIAAGNDWDAVFTTAAADLAEGLAPR